MMRQTSYRWDLRYGKRWKGIIEMWSKGRGEPEALILRMTLVICLHKGGDKFYCTSGAVASFHMYRFVLLARVLFKYLVVKLKMLVGRLLWALYHEELSFFRDLSRRNDMVKPWDDSLDWSFSALSARTILRPCFCIFVSVVLDISSTIGAYQ